MTQISRQESGIAPGGPRQMGAGQAAWLQMAPGIASLPVFALLAWLLTKQGIPTIFALALAILIAPWNWLPFFLMTIPWAYLVWWRRSIRIGLFIHVGMLALQWVGMSLILFGLVPVPG